MAIAGQFVLGQAKPRGASYRVRLNSRRFDKCRTNAERFNTKSVHEVLLKERSMLGIRYIKVPPTTFVLHYQYGRVVRSGAGLAFFYYAPNSEIVTVPHD